MRIDFEKTLNQMLYEKFWLNRKNILIFKVLYILIPWLLLGGMYAIILFKNAGHINGGYGFWNDITNYFVLPYMFLVSYYVAGYNPKYLRNTIASFKNKVCKKETNEKDFNKIIHLDKYRKIINILVFVLALAGWWFISVADSNGNNNWYSLLSPELLSYYKFFVLFSWYASGNVLIDTIFTSIKVYKISQMKLNIDLNSPDKSGGLSKVFTMLFWNIGLAAFFFTSTLIIILSDYRAYKFNVDNAFHRYPVLIVIVVMVLIFYLSFTIVPLLECEKIIKKKCNEKDGEEIKISIINLKNVAAVLSTSIVYIINFMKMLIK